MILMKVVQGDTIPGAERHTFICAACHRVEQQVVFMRHGREREPEPMPIIPHDLLHQLRFLRRIGL
jgi:hypothetical protein